MAEIGHWANITFVVSSDVIRSFKDLTIEGSVETEEVTDNSIKYVKNKARQPTEVSLTVQLDARLGNDVRGLASDLVDGATYGREEYFYIAGKKLVPYKLKLVRASVSEIQMSSDGTWICCDVKMNMKQSGMPDQYAPSSPAPASGGGGSSSGGGGYPAAQGSKKVTVTPTRTTTTKTVASALPASTKTAVSTAVSTISKITTAAKVVTAVTKPSVVRTAVKKVTSVASKIINLFKKK